jgi:integrase
VLYKAFKDVIEALGLPYIRLHDMRHTHGTLLLEQGESLKMVAERLGHSSIRITADRYLHVSGEMQERAMERLDTTFQSSCDLDVTKEPQPPVELAEKRQEKA